MTQSTKLNLTKIASLACVVHCILAPFLVMAAPLFGHVFHNPFMEFGIVIFSILSGIAIIYSGYCNHKKKHAAIVFFVGVSFWIANAILETIYQTHFHLELLSLGTLFVLIAYKINHDQAKPCCTDHHH